MHKKHLVLSVLILLILFSNQALCEEKFEIAYDITTKQDMRESFGEPSSIRYAPEGEEVWLYHNIMVEVLEDKTRLPDGLIFMIMFDETETVIGVQFESLQKESSLNEGE